MRVRLACLIWVASMSFCLSECQCYEPVSWQESKQERKQAKQVDNQEEKKKKLAEIRDLHKPIDHKEIVSHIHSVDSRIK